MSSGITATEEPGDVARITPTEGVGAAGITPTKEVGAIGITPTEKAGAGLM